MGNMVENTMPLRSFKATFQVNWIRFTFLRNTWPFFGISANFRYTAVFNNGTCQQYPDAPWCWNIYLHDWPKFLAVNLGKYSSTMVRIWVIGYMMLGFSMRFPVIAPRTIPRTLQKKAVFAGRALDRGNGQLVLLGQGHGFLEGQRCDSPGENVQEVASPFFCAKKTQVKVDRFSLFFLQESPVEPR